MNAFQAYFQCHPTPTAVDLELYQLAQTYYLQTEAFDRTVCTGPIRHGEILPASEDERRRINAHAAEVLSRLQERARLLHPNGIELLRDEMKRYVRSGQAHADIAARLGGSRQYHP